MHWSRCFFALVAALGLGGGAAPGAEAVVVASGESAHSPGQPQLAIDASGVIHLVYGVENSVTYCRSEDGGRSYVRNTPLPETKTLSLGMRRGPRIAAAGQFVCVTAIGGKQGKGRDGDVLAFHSADHGTTWSGPVTVNEVPDAAREGLHAMAAGPAGELCCVWLDLRNGQTEIFAALSKDGGKSWEKNLVVYRSPDGHVCECCHPSVAYDTNGNLHVMWRNWLGGARDMYVSRSIDGGRTFGQAAKLGNGTWPLDACPMDGGCLATAKEGIFTAWRRNAAVFLTTPSTPAEQRIGAGEQPWIAVTDLGPFVVWLEEGSDRLLLRTPANPHPAELSAKAAAPIIACSLDGKGPIIAAWEEKHGKRTTIYCKAISDSGRSP
jgi:hypothetical protein